MNNVLDKPYNFTRTPNRHVRETRQLRRGFRQPPGRTPEKFPGNTPDNSIVDQEATRLNLHRRQKQPVLCKACGHPITTTGEIVAVSNSHQHIFANPGGLVFTIGCFRTAPGCMTTGPLTAEFSWFRGYQWRIAICASCHIHIGWMFAGTGHSFFGLILDRLTNA